MNARDVRLARAKGYTYAVELVKPDGDVHKTNLYCTLAGAERKVAALWARSKKPELAGWQTVLTPLSKEVPE